MALRSTRDEPMPEFSFDGLKPTIERAMTGAVIRIGVFGKAVAKGSAKAFPYEDKQGKLHAAVVADNRDNLKAWEATIGTQAQMLAFERKGQLLEGAIYIRVFFGIERPPSVSEKKRPMPTAKPDLDKLVRAAMDPLTKVLIKDDAVIVSCESHKRYVVGAPFAVIELRALSADATPMSLPMGEPVPAPPARMPSVRAGLSEMDL